MASETYRFMIGGGGFLLLLRRRRGRREQGGRREDGGGGGPHDLGGREDFMAEQSPMWDFYHSISAI